MNILLVAIRLFVYLTCLTGIIYPLIITGVGRVSFYHTTHGSVVNLHGKPIGSVLLAQEFVSPVHVSSRPSAANYATLPSGASNLGPGSATLKVARDDRKQDWTTKNQTSAPPEMVCASGSGLDPHISPAAAYNQLGRIAASRHWDANQRDAARAIVARLIENPLWGAFGDARVNVLLLNLELDKL